MEAEKPKKEEPTTPTTQPTTPITLVTPEITFDEFMKLDLRVGKILEVIPVEKSKKLMRVMVDFGYEKRKAVAGLMQYYKPEDLVGKKCVFLLNLKKRMMAGFESQCMILAAEDNEGTVAVLQPEKDVAEGSKVG
jgi:methionine--tRNA ligase beta chain